MAPPPELIDDAVAEILLRLPPDDPACLLRASLVCKPWRCVLSDPAFPRRYREFHRTPPLLGAIHCLYAGGGGDIARFAPTTARIPFLEPEFICQALDCRHGRVLLDMIWDTSAGLGLAVWDPITGDRTMLPKPDGRRFRSHYGAVLCAAADCDHRDCRGKPFLVVFVGDTASGVASAWVYSSEAAAWSAPASVQIGERFLVATRRGAIVGDEIHFLLGLDDNDDAAILKFDLRKRCLSLVRLTGGLNVHAVVLMPMEDGSLGLAGVNGSTLHLWSRKVNPEGVARWVQCRAIALDKVLPIDNPNHRANVMGFAEGVGVVMVRADASAFMLELKSGQVKKVTMPRYFVDVLPFMSFYIPDFTSSKLQLLGETN